MLYRISRSKQFRELVVVFIVDNNQPFSIFSNLYLQEIFWIFR